MAASEVSSRSTCTAACDTTRPFYQRLVTTAEAEQVPCLPEHSTKPLASALVARGTVEAFSSGNVGFLRAAALPSGPSDPAVMPNSPAFISIREFVDAVGELGRGVLGLLPPPRVELIWNATPVCPWDCQKCCVSARHVTREDDGKVWLSSADLTSRIPIGSSEGLRGNAVYDLAARHLQELGVELDLDAKIALLDNLAGTAPKIDLSGGDLPVVSDSRRLIAGAASRFGRTNVTVTATGVGLRYLDADFLNTHIGELNFTYDGKPPDDPEALCPDNYANVNLNKAAELAAAGVSVRAEIPLTLQNIDPAQLEQVYRDLADRGIPRLLVMRLFPVGRGELRDDQIPTGGQYHAAIAQLRRLEADLGGPTVKLQCALKALEPLPAGAANPCDAAIESYGLMADGTLLASPWAIDQHGRPLNDDWVLGNLATTPMTEILLGKKVRAYLDATDADNRGHCRLFTTHHAPETTDHCTALTLPTDPIHTTTAVTIR